MVRARAVDCYQTHTVGYSYIKVQPSVLVGSRKIMMMKVISECGNTCIAKTGEKVSLGRSFKLNDVSLHTSQFYGRTYVEFSCCVSLISDCTCCGLVSVCTLTFWLCKHCRLFVSKSEHCWRKHCNPANLVTVTCDLAEPVPQQCN